MPNLESRIEALEKSQPQDNAVTTIFILPMSPGETECDWDWNCARTIDGNRTWTRKLGESVEAFKERIDADSEPHKVQLVMLDNEPTAGS
ncbi:hypothetical protein [Diaphorobacter nitroreducens]|jgi:hypothetical protein|uniref:hypothetical protein n=1 Tax=Diaphorobacter nitroreducens TaxID=164759 RepID=UPI0000DC932F|nr:hypothetical protein [Diaphorobacter nitroreducens]ABM41917.1 hypothetical protein Ajs_1727 [Acidovorax sp. JS42]